MAIRTSFPVSLISLITLLVTLATPHTATAEDTSKLHVKVGGIYGLTGPLADFSMQFKNGATLAAEDINANNDIHLEVLFEDSRWQTIAAVTAYKKLRDSNQVQIVHVSGSPMTLAIKPLSEKETLLTNL